MGVCGPVVLEGKDSWATEGQGAMQNASMQRVTDNSAAEVRTTIHVALMFW